LLFVALVIFQRKMGGDSSRRPLRLLQFITSVQSAQSPAPFGHATKWTQYHTHNFRNLAGSFTIPRTAKFLFWLH